MKTTNKKTIVYIIALLVPPLGIYLAVDMRHKWRHLSLIIAAALLTMIFYPLGLAFALLIIYTHMPDEEPPEEADPNTEPAAEDSISLDEDDAAPQPIPGLADTSDDRPRPVPQALPGLSTDDDTSPTRKKTNQPGEGATDPNPSAENSTLAGESAEEVEQSE